MVVRKWLPDLAGLVSLGAAVWATPQAIELRPGARPGGSPFREGDAPLPKENGLLAWIRDGRQVATLVDRDGGIEDRSDGSQPLSVTDAAGDPVLEPRPDATLFVSREAPEIVYLRQGLPRRRPYRHSCSPLMTLHGGDVLAASKTFAVFWGAQWEDASFAGDMIAGTDTFFAGFGGSNQAALSTEYYGTTNGYASTSSTYLGHTIDRTVRPSRALTPSGVVAEVCKVLHNQVDADAVYLVYTPSTPAGVNYCAWRSWGACGTGSGPVLIQVAYVPNPDGTVGCDPAATWTSHSRRLASLADSTAHELSEAITDPRGGGWFDVGGAENADKCVSVFAGSVTLQNGSVWKLQAQWSNAAHSGNTGYPNASGEKACLQGR